MDSQPKPNILSSGRLNEHHVSISTSSSYAIGVKVSGNCRMCKNHSYHLFDYDSQGGFVGGLCHSCWSAIELEL
jgi:hypothetical protein